MKKLFVLAALVSSGWLLATPRCLPAQGPQKVAEVEGISEYRLDNGCRVLLFPDQSTGNVTVNMTVFVGSRHEGYGETGMAHLLEHMLFKGTPAHPKIPQEFRDRGAIDFNGTTWYDRTNYYETVPASAENLEWAIGLEADRLINSFIRAEDLASEMTVVRNEFEQGENSPQGILFQRIMANAYEWHNYGKSTIGNRADIERVPVTSLRDFYRKYYQPDNIMVVVAGQFDSQKALELVQKHFGSIPRPERELPKTYTLEPDQDGERTVMLRRAGDVSVVGVGYHIPAAAHEDFAAVQVLSGILGTEPSGRLYQSLVKTQKASSVSSMEIAGHDPGMLICSANVPDAQKVETVRQTLLETIEKIGDTGVKDEEVKRVVAELTKQREDLQANTQSFAVELSEWAAYGDWRLFFIHRDRLEKVSAADVQRVAKRYLMLSNRTVGIFQPTQTIRRAEIPSTPRIARLVDNYKGRGKIAEGETFEPTPANIERRTLRGKLSTGLRYALLPKSTRGERVYMMLTLRYGSEESLSPQRLSDACDVLPELWTRGTKSLSYQEVEDKLNEYKASLSANGSAGSVGFTIRARKKTFSQTLDLLHEVLREPALLESEFDVIQRESLAQIKSMRSEPQMLAQMALMRKIMPYPKGDIRYVPTMDEMIQRTEALRCQDVQRVYNELLNGQHGELTIVGDFDPDEVLPKIEAMLTNWVSKHPYQRISQTAHTNVPGETITIQTPDKANAVYMAGLTIAVRDDDEDYEAMSIGNSILGGGALSNRLADRVRQKEGLSYGVGSQFDAGSLDTVGNFFAYAISNPQNRDKVVTAIAEEMNRLLEQGVSQDELQRAKEGYLKQLKGTLSRDQNIVQLLHSNQRLDRTMEFVERHQNKIRSLTKEEVDQAVQKMLPIKRLVIVTAGDFDKKEK